jgi:hypothetical protein
MVMKNPLLSQADDLLTEPLLFHLNSADISILASAYPHMIWLFSLSLRVCLIESLVPRDMGSREARRTAGDRSEESVSSPRALRATVHRLALGRCAQGISLAVTCKKKKKKKKEKTCVLSRKQKHYD